jgi:subtilisin family serine protease
VPAANAAVNPDNRSVVEFNGPVRKDFSARVAALGGAVDFISENGGFAAVTGLTAEAAASLSKLAGVASVFDDAVVQVNDVTTIGEMATPDVSAMSIANPAGSFRFNYQWNMRAIGANTAWAAGNLGSANVVAAILDSGIDYDSFDMNGMVDLATSTSFVASDNPIIAANFPGRNAIDDLNLHGTNVATQVSSNATIFAGVNSRARLMAVKVLGTNGAGLLSGVLAGIIWAADHGADVANLSLGVDAGIDKAGNGRFVGITNQVLNYAHRKGMVIVVSAGNAGINLDIGRNFAVYCEAPHVICVSALGPTASTNAFSGPWTNVDAFASYSNSGRKSITVSAPGGTGFGVVSSVCARHARFVSAGGTVSFPCNVPPGFFVTIGAAGTSQSAPHVTGVVAQLIAKYGKGQPSQIKQMLLNSVDDLGPPGPDDFYGAGRVNLVKALSQ